VAAAAAWRRLPSAVRHGCAGRPTSVQAAPRPPPRRVAGSSRALGRAGGVVG